MILDRQSSDRVTFDARYADGSDHRGAFARGETRTSIFGVGGTIGRGGANTYHLRLENLVNAIPGVPTEIFVEVLDRDLVVREGLPACAYCAVQALLKRYDFPFDNGCPGLEDDSLAALPRSFGASAPVATLRALRDQLMATTAAGRYYTLLYETLSPAIETAVFRRPSIIVDVLHAQGPWLDGIAALLAGQGSAAVISSAMANDLNRILDRLEEGGDPELRRVLDLERARLHLDALAGVTMQEAWNRVNDLGGPRPCAASDRALCLNGGRFRVEADWTTPQVGAGVGHAVGLTGDTGYFWFFGSANVEVIVKAIDGRPVNDHWWLFYGALSDVAYTLTVTDTQTGRIHAYANPQGTLASVGDTGAFDGDDGAVSSGSRGRATSRAAGADRPQQPPAGAPGAPLTELPSAAGIGHAATAAGACAATATSLCLGSGRFRVRASWRDFHGRSGVGEAVSLTPDTGYFWFFGSSNVEVVVKVLDGLPVNGHFWLFSGSLSNVEYHLTVEDTVTGAVRTYDNPSGRFASVADTEAF